MTPPVSGRQSDGPETSDGSERRRGSGSFLGAEESDEEIAFRGSSNDSLGEFTRVTLKLSNSDLREHFTNLYEHCLYLSVFC